MNLVANCITEMPSIANQVCPLFNVHDVICLHGTMGVGKTTFIKELCREIGVVDKVSSPTFSIVNEYHNLIGESIYHFDFYRINSETEAYDLGYEEYFYSKNLCFIEWPERISSILPKKRLDIFIKNIDGSRIINIKRL
tara:strand:- start:19802 stop:20218 length:417 start_codon:yes stop_codon:yes gene_type:complete